MLRKGYLPNSTVELLATRVLTISTKRRSLAVRTLGSAKVGIVPQGNNVIIKRTRRSDEIAHQTVEVFRALFFEGTNDLLPEKLLNVVIGRSPLTLVFYPIGAASSRMRREVFYTGVNLQVENI